MPTNLLFSLPVFFFAKFEERVKEIERCRAIYKFALDSIPKSKAEDLYQVYVCVSVCVCVYIPSEGICIHIYVWM
jgi:hypothetical protein